jgi:hypothetical protein
MNDSIIPYTMCARENDASGCKVNISFADLDHMAALPLEFALTMESNDFTLHFARDDKGHLTIAIAGHHTGDLALINLEGPVNPTVHYVPVTD